MRAHEHLIRVAESRSGAAIDAGVEFARGTLGITGVSANALERRAWLLRALGRPMRVCGMVPNTGEPGGGPFWTRGADGTRSLQIVESAQIDMTSPDQRAIFEASTHFNPVFLACALRDERGTPYYLEPFVDPGASIVTRKSWGGRELVTLERPGLWNGAMSRWNTIFVEVPGTVFNPVKTVLDLLREPHQPVPER
jgi:hypothetical protein